MDSNFYDKKWQDWDDMVKYSPAPRHRRRIVIKTIKRYYQAGFSLHDVGCGNSALLLETREKIGHLRLSGSDISTATIENNRKKYKEIEYYSFDIGGEVDHADRYDIITCSEVLEHVEKTEIALKNLNNLLNPDGIAIITVPGGKICPIDELVGHYRHFYDGSLFEEAFEIKELIWWGFPFFNLYKWAINLFHEKSLEGFARNRYGPFKKLISNLIYFLFYLNLPVWGSQLVLVLKAKNVKW